MDPFIKDPKEYTRDFLLRERYYKDAAQYLHLHTGKPLDQCEAYVRRETGPGGKFEMVDPRVKVLIKNKVGDKELKYTTFSKLIAAVKRRGAILSPSLVAYVPHAEEESLNAIVMDANINARKVEKAAKFKAKAEGNLLLASIKDLLQNGLKIFNNGQSGAYSSSGTPLYNKSAHTSLTSCCRTITSSTNAFNEKFLGGNRHYHNPEIVRTNFMVIINNVNFERIEQVMTKYGLVHPTVDAVMEMLHHSTYRYWELPKEYRKLREMVERLSPIQRSAIMYTSDMYSLRMSNPDFVRRFLTELADIRQDYEVDRLPDIKMNCPDLKTLSVMKVAKESVDLSKWQDNTYVEAYKRQGGDPKDEKAFKKWVGSVVDKEPKELRGLSHMTEEERVYNANQEKHIKHLLIRNYQHVLQVTEKYADFIETFWRTDLTPSSIASILGIEREIVLTSDTDSSIFTQEGWVNWMYPDRIDRPKRIAVNATMTYLIRKQDIHLLAMISANIGVPLKHLFRLTMKNEYYFGSFALTNMSKHYFAWMIAQEGAFFKERELERKGVHLRSSNLPKSILDQGTKFITDILDLVADNGSFSAAEQLNRIGNLERQIINSVKGGESTYLSKAQIRPIETYNKPMSQPYFYHVLWDEVFADRYGKAPPPPYLGIKVNVDLNNKTKVLAWIENIEDHGVRERMRVFYDTYSRTSFNSFIVPMDIVSNIGGMPQEIIDCADIRTMLQENLHMVYAPLESTGLYFANRYNTRLVSDEH